MPTLQLLLERLRGGGASSGGGGSPGRGGPGGGGSGGRSGGGPWACLFTDFNEEAVWRSRQLLDYLLVGQAGPPAQQPGASIAASGGSGGGVAVEAGLHPWRKPAAVLASDNALPSAASGFALWLTRYAT